MEEYPDSGYLEFHIAVKDDDVYGVDFDNQQSQESFRVLYFDEDSVQDPETDFDFLADTLRSDNSPVSKPHALTFNLQDDYLGVGDIRYNKNAKSLSLINEKYPNFEEQFEDEIAKKFSCIGHKIGGYAYFTQTDPREYLNCY